MHIKPTVGRVVHYHPGPDRENIPGCSGDQPLAAIVAHVWSDTWVNLAVFDANGNSHSRTSVFLVQDGMPAPGAQYAEWMPYQKGQAAKTEALETVIAGGSGQCGSLCSDHVSGSDQPAP